MKRLSLSEELALLQKAYQYGEYLDNGSSRSVYDMGDGTVLKVASCKRGQFQNGMEIETFRNGRYQDSLAEIYSYGKYVVLMEKICPIGFELVEFLYNNGNYESEVEHYWGEYGLEIASRQGELIEHIRNMEEMLGETVDNYQVGIDDDNNIKAFDYGFESSSYQLSVSDELNNDLSQYGYNEFLIYVASKLLHKEYQDMNAY